MLSTVPGFESTGLSIAGRLKNHYLYLTSICLLKYLNAISKNLLEI